MASMKEFLSDPYLKPSDVVEDVWVVITGISIEEVGPDREHKLVVFSALKPLVVDENIRKDLASRFGDDPAKWVGRWIGLLPYKITYPSRDPVYRFNVTYKDAEEMADDARHLAWLDQQDLLRQSR